MLLDVHRITLGLNKSLPNDLKTTLASDIGSFGTQNTLHSLFDANKSISNKNKRLYAFKIITSGLNSSNTPLSFDHIARGKVA